MSEDISVLIIYFLNSNIESFSGWFLIEFGLFIIKILLLNFSKKYVEVI